MCVELSSLLSQPSTSTNNILKEAAAVLGLPDYERFKSNTRRAFSDYSLQNVCDHSGVVIGHQVCSIQYPDDPPRPFLINSNKRCLCKERVADNSMCPHEIRVYGFDKSKFEERDFWRLCAKGSSSETKSLVDSIIEFEPEEFETSSQSSLKFSSACPPLPPLEQNSASLLPGFIPDKSIKVKPFLKKEVSNIFYDALAKYPSLDDNTKFELNGLALQIQSLLISDPTDTTVDHGTGELSTDIPSQQRIVSQKKGRLMCPQEKKTRQVKKSSKSIAGECFVPTTFSVFQLRHCLLHIVSQL